MEPMQEVYARYAATVYRYLFTLTHDAALSEELTQETFYQALRSIDTFRGDCKVSTWLCGIAKRLWYKHLKKQRSDAPFEWAEKTNPSAEEEALARDAHITLMRHIHELGEPTREVMYLRLSGGLTFREIGDVLGKTEVWARVTFYRAKERLEVRRNEE
ncbi:MAG TPA: sigma-70 family RNA polymerase sigma factor [Clostridia bacterium]|nr:sigma-70 family RNA polymerase sigma factor [Clostridia bacterium]